MIDSPKNTHITLSNLGRLLKEKMALVSVESEQIKSLKQEVRAIMIANSLKEFENPDIELYMKCQRSFSFDIGTFKIEMPKFSKSFITQETITTTRDVFDKKRLMKNYPEDYKKYLLENTPRLTVK